MMKWSTIIDANWDELVKTLEHAYHDTYDISHDLIKAVMLNKSGEIYVEWTWENTLNPDVRSGDAIYIARFPGVDEDDFNPYWEASDFLSEVLIMQEYEEWNSEQ